MKVEFNWPIKPHALNQGWGAHRPDVYGQFGFTDHNGLDHAFFDSKNIYAPCDGLLDWMDNQPNGGGIYVSLVSDPMDFPAFSCVTPDGRTVAFKSGTYRTRIDFLHLEKPLVKVGQRVKAGDLIAIGDNTGFSTGPHCHTQWRRVEGPNNAHVDTNDANNSFDPTQFFTGVYAKDLQTWFALAGKLIAAMQTFLKARSA